MHGCKLCDRPAPQAQRPLRTTDPFWREPDVTAVWKLDRELASCDFRGIDIKRLGHVLSFGVDVEPADAVIWTDCFDKAWEYSNYPKLLLAYKISALKPTFQELSADASTEEHRSVRQSFPTAVAVAPGKIWYSRLPADDTRVTSQNEVAYGRWIPGNPFEALQAIIIVCRPEDEENCSSAFAPS